MNPAEWERLKPLFEHAIELPQDERRAFVEEIRHQDESLGSRLADLIKAHEERTEPMDQPVVRFGQVPAAEKPLFSPGELVLGRFRIVRMVGRGGMGEVYEANDLELGRVALKTVRAAAAGNPQTLLRFKQEVQLARKVTSPYVCRIYELHTVTRPDRADPVIFLTMEFLEGVTLAARIAQQRALPVDEAGRIASQLCAALQAIHEAGVIHRDFKSNNVMLVARGGMPQAVVTDLGLAAEAAAAARAESGITQPGAVMGTSEYMAPEQFEGRPVTPAADVYALGVVLYELATGTRPFQAPNLVASAVRRARHLPAPSSIHSDLPAHWDAVINKCLSYDAENRYQSAGEVAAALQNPPPRISATPLPTPALRWSWKLGSFLASMLLIAAVAAFLWSRSRAYPPPPGEAQRWYLRGAAALHEGTYLKATHALERALKLDGNFVLAHAGLADAWNELDFTRKAQDEMLRASGLDVGSRLPKRDKQYLAAVRYTLTGQFPAAVQNYGAILNELPANEKAYGLVDLGRANEKAGNVVEARKNYEKAAKLAPEDPAPFMHLGILESRAGHSAEGETAFSHAAELYNASSNREGLAEIAYQRGYAALGRGDAPKARPLLEESLHAARDLDSPQLQIRALTRRSMLEYAVGNIPKAIELGNSAIDLARERGLDIWATEGLIRVAIDYIELQDLVHAETDVQKGLRLAQDLKNPRLEALARLTLASLRDQQGASPSERITLAQQAFDYYKTTGYSGMANNARMLLVRARTDNAEFAQASRDAWALIDDARKSTDAIAIAQAEETAGGMLISLQRYPDALAHYQSALAAARASGQLVEFEAANCADALWHLGRYAEAKQMIDSIPPDKRKEQSTAVMLDRVSAAMALSQRRFKDALALAGRALKPVSASKPAQIIELQIISGMAQAELGLINQSQQNCQSALDSARQRDDREMSAQADLCAASSYLAANAPQNARPLAEAARQFFAGSQQKESEWRSFLYLAQACEKSGDAASAQYAKKALDILSGLENNWGNQTYQLYVSRPDVQAARQQLSKLARK